MKRTNQNNGHGYDQSESQSNHNSSQQNIKITIESTTPQPTDQLPPRITVSHIQKSQFDK